MTSQRTDKRFFIVKTITGNYFYGSTANNYNKYDFYSNPVKIGMFLIPSANIDYMRLLLTEKEFRNVGDTLNIESESILEIINNNGYKAILRV